jgi:prepilin-type processing-associated H-X9-DG protein
MNLETSSQQQSKTFSIKSPSQKFQFGDSDNWMMKIKSSNYKVYFDQIYTTGFIDNGGFTGILPRHRAGTGYAANVAFFDGHTEAVPKEETYFYGSGAADKIAERWKIFY